MTEHQPFTWGGTPPGSIFEARSDMCNPGDRPDPTAATRKPYCSDNAEQHGYCCTRPAGHDGQHVAGTGTYVAATWDDRILKVFIGYPQW
jgi:hypothetical protein